MSLLSSLLSPSPIITLLLAIGLPALLPRLLAFLRPRPPPSPPSQPFPLPPRPPTPPALKLLLALHTLWCISRLLLPPYDLFVTPSLPIFTSNDVLRAVLSRRARLVDPSSYSPAVSDHPLDELLLQRLQSLDNRYLYARFGHTPLRECVWCRDVHDFLVYSLAGALAPYVAGGVVLGLMGLESVGGGEAGRRAARWRKGFGWVLAGLAGGEVVVRLMWDVRAVEGDCVHLNQTLHTLRYILLLPLPLIYTLLPPSPPPVPALSALFPSLSNAQQTLRLASLSRAATARSPHLRTLWARTAEHDAATSKRGREDARVKARVNELGVGDEAWGRAGRWVREGWQGLIRLEKPGRRDDMGK